MPTTVPVPAINGGTTVPAINGSTLTTWAISAPGMGFSPPILVNGQLLTLSPTNATFCTVLNVEPSQLLYAYISGFNLTPSGETMIAPFLFEPIGSGAVFFHSTNMLPPLTTSLVNINNNLYATHPAVANGGRPRVTKPAILRRRLLNGRRALRRSVDLYCSLRPAEELQTFMRGEPLLIHGHRFDYRLRKRANVLTHTMEPWSPHIPYHLNLLDRRTGKHLSSGCVVLRNTPVIDQLLAFILHAESPEDELLMLRRTNWTPQLPPRVWFSDKTAQSLAA